MNKAKAKNPFCLSPFNDATRMISLEEIPDLAAVEEYFVRLRDTDATDLAVPVQLSDNGIGFQAATIQLILTWAHRNPASHLIVLDSKNQLGSGDLRTLCATEHGLLAVLLAPRVATGPGMSVVANAIDECHAAYDEIAKKPISTPNSSFFLVSNRLGGTEHAYDHLSPKTAPASRIEWFKGEVNRQVERSVSQSSAKHFSPDDSKDIAEIVYEVFANAEEWGSKKIDGEDIRPNARGIILKIHNITSENLTGPNISTPTAKYLQRWNSGQDTARNFLEISIFDAGIGLAQHARRKPITDTTPLRDEYDMVMRCLRKYASASGRTFRGLGLHYVMSLLTKTKGFLRYRSGRLSLFRDFQEQPFMPALGHETLDSTRQSTFRSKNIYFFDWVSQSMDLTQAPLVDGALFTMVFPLKPADQQLRFREVVPAPGTG